MGRQLTRTRSSRHSYVVERPVTIVRHMVDGALRLPYSRRVDGENGPSPSSDILVGPDLPHFIRGLEANF